MAGDGLFESRWTNRKVLAGERISGGRGARNCIAGRSEELGALANARRDLAKAKSYAGRGREIVTYIVDRNINYTNVCNVYCKFCAFYRTEKDEDHYVLSFEQIDQKLDELSAVGGVQILMQAGIIRNCRSNGISICCVTSGKISAHQYSRVQSAGVSTFRRDFPDAAARSDFGIQEGWTWINSGRRRRNSGRSGAEKNFAVEN